MAVEDELSTLIVLAATILPMA